ncbi:histidine phosphatase family protein [Streptomyces sp. MS1.HAVA.3]|uniref:Histidine phosphatase family protein n=1 Tax=Streptomyces caledonius TaxID=3134107 RepID=A0ABU8U735_9ACTN
MPRVRGPAGSGHRGVGGAHPGRGGGRGPGGRARLADGPRVRAAGRGVRGRADRARRAELAALAAGTHRAVVEQAVVRAAVVHALDLPAAAFWRLDVRPESVTTLTGRAGRWNLLVGQPEDGPQQDRQ